MKIKRKGILFVISAPSGAGKTTLCREAANRLDNLEFSISYTTRPPRPGEENGRDYHFVDEETFLEMVEKGEMAEWARVYNHLYGTPKAPLLKAIEAGKDILLDIDIQGASQIKAAFPEDAVTIFVFPPSLEALRERLSKRGADAPQVIKERWEKAEEEMAMYPLFRYFVVNDRLEEAIEDLIAVIKAERHRVERIKETQW